MRRAAAPGDGRGAPDLAPILARGLERLELPLDAAARQRLLRFVELLARWNRAYNLTAVREPAAMLTHHLLDSLAVAPFVEGPRIVDVGTGAGLPGLPLALACPERHFVLLDSRAKKTRFVTQAAAELGLSNLDVVNSRVQDYAPSAPFDTVLTRAFSSLDEMLAVTRHLCAPRGLFLALKGAFPESELAALPAGVAVERVAPLTVPGLSAARHVVLLRNGAND